MPLYILVLGKIYIKAVLDSKPLQFVLSINYQLSVYYIEMMFRKGFFWVLAACETYSHKRLEAFGPEKLLIVSSKCTLIRCDSPNFQGSAF